MCFPFSPFHLSLSTGFVPLPIMQIEILNEAELALLETVCCRVKPYRDIVVISHLMGCLGFISGVG